METSYSKIIIGLVVVALVGFFGYKLFFSSTDDTKVKSQNQDAKEILDLASQLNSVKIDSALFTSNIFTSLRDYTPTPSAEVQGRSDPFRDIGSEDGGFVIPPIGIKNR